MGQTIEVTKFNIKQVEALTTPIVVINAVRAATRADQGDVNDENEVDDMVALAGNARVMLRKNLWVGHGPTTLVFKLNAFPELSYL